MSNKAITWAYTQSQLKQGPKFVLVTLADMADQENSCYPGIPLLATLTGASESSVRAQLQLLQDLGLVTQERRHRPDGSRTSNRYYLQLEPKIQAPDSGGRDSEDQRQNLQGQAPDSGGPSARIWGGLLNPQIEPSEEPKDIALLPREDQSPPDGFALFWKVWPRSESRKAAERAWSRAVRRAPAQLILDRATAYATHPYRPARDYVPYGATWLNGDKWNDPDPQPPTDKPSVVDQGRLVDQQIRDREAQRQLGLDS